MSKNNDHQQVVNILMVRVKEGGFILLIALALFLFISLWSFSSQDPGWTKAGDVIEIQNASGRAGAWFASFFLHLFGYLAFLFPFMVIYSGYLLFRERKNTLPNSFAFWSFRLFGLIFTLLLGAAISSLHFAEPQMADAYLSGGVLGKLLGDLLVSWFNSVGATLILLAAFFASMTLFTGISWFQLMDWVGKMTLDGIAWISQKSMELLDRIKDKRTQKEIKQQREAVFKQEKVKIEKRAPVQISQEVKRIEPSVRTEKEKQVSLFDDTPVEGELPPVRLLDEPKPHTNSMSNEALEALSRLVELKLADFKVEAQVVAVHPGPVITRFELDLAAGVKVARITNLAKDLSRALSTTSVRVVEVIPGKPYIGIEVPNENREIVRLKEVIASRAFDDSRSNLSMALGKDISGAPTVIDLIKMPHLLVAGTTGSGKSVGLNAMIVSILYKSTPEDVRLIMIDPKMLELSVYEGIPHLLTPVVTDMKEAANSLRWAVAEMERRYRLMSALGVRNLAGFNRKVNDAIKRGEPIRDPLWQPQDSMDEQAPELEPLPKIVIVIDELADMMMIVGKKVEELIARIAQKARAAGIHLLLATQRPSVDVITGLIKANIPSRIAFQVSSKIDSRTILDQVGAEQLLGQGDMLYLPGGTSIPTRVHGAFVDDDEVHRIVGDWKKRGEPVYEDSITSGASDVEIPGMPGAADEGGEKDELYDHAVQIVTETRKASISGVQRRLKIGYNRAARMIEEMEAAGIVSEMQSNGSREVLAPPPPPA
ncbi:DNA translocase FtsK [Aliikangiella coralliicola]|uniref:DNA translocase FtsK n=1 Tax=Aliikangiella coralliicola TaxID=2592383 RepID=A0A545UAL5_9GAMM|nr:DNA translocase FtsK [Aliikangiella coralliicola]TQV86506.1 cell division protein FtsK [Aliikangiella coralliicola]